jgi:hypothetical protein
MATDVARGGYVDPALGRTKFGGYARGWLAVQTFDVSTREQVEHRLRVYVYPTWEDVPLSDALAVLLSEHIRQFPPVTVELPWGDPGAAKVRKVKVSLLFTSRERKALNRSCRCVYLRGRRVPRPSRRGFTLRTYTHLMPSAEERTRLASDVLFACVSGNDDVPVLARELDDCPVARCAQLDVASMDGVVAGIPQSSGDERRQVFVDEELHAGCRSGSSRSLTASAA